MLKKILSLFIFEMFVYALYMLRAIQLHRCAWDNVYPSEI